MLNLNDDMDDLIRQAADDYPLKTGEGKDWDKVLAGLQSSAPITPVNNKKYRWLLLLLLPLLLAMPVVYKNVIQKPVISSSAKRTGTTKQEAATITTEQANKASKQADRSNNKAINAETNRAALTENKKETSTNNHSNTKPAINKNTVVVSNKVNSKKKSVAKNDNLVDDIISAPVINAGTSSNDNSNSAALENNNKVSSADSTSKTIAVTKATAKRSAENEKAVTTTDSIHLNTAIAPQNDSAATVTKMNIKHTTPVKTRGLYVSVAAALDATTVKLHKIDKIGYTTSVVLGYRINNHWSVETGLMWDKKDYYSPGKYLDKLKTGFSADYNIHYLNGYCKMFEVPVTVKYDFRSKKKNGFFVAAGLSSYIMHRESYNYFVSHYSAPSAPGYFRQKDYVNTTTNLFSVVNISGGHQFIFKNNNSLRIEPYLKVPLSGLGIGKLPFTSTGISAAYTLPIH